MQRAWSALESAEQVLSTGPGPEVEKYPVESDGIFLGGRYPLVICYKKLLKMAQSK